MVLTAAAVPDGCFITLSDNRLTAGNRQFRRTWRVAPNGLLYAESFHDAVGDLEWLLAASKQPAPTPSSEVALPEETRSATLRLLPKPSVVEADSVCAELTVAGKEGTLRYFLQVFPNCRGVRMRLTAEGSAGSVETAEAVSGDATPTGIETDPVRETGRKNAETDTLDALTLAPLHLRLTQIALQDQTDHHNELVFETEWLLHTCEKTLQLSGSLFYVEDVLTGAGLIFLKEAPLPYARPVPSAYDLQVRGLDRRVTFAGNGADATGEGYPFITLAYDGGKTGRIEAIQKYQRCLRPYGPARDGMLVSNTWGDRNRDERIAAAFMEKEIEAGARLGVDVIQIDDGWEVGATSNSVRAKDIGGVWEGYYAAWDNFWSVNPERFPHGLEPLIATARDKGMRFGLWFGPDSSGDFENWRRDADTILRLHRELGIDYIKIDGVKVRTKIGERHLRAFFDRVLNESDGNIVFDLDVTAEVRPAYFGMINVGPLFVENRYTDWRRYWPHQTLRCLWKLAPHVDPVRLRLEFLNHARNPEQYEGDPLAPSAYRSDYLFATVMFASPLGWFEVANLPESYFTDAAPLIAIWKAHREAIFSGTILPIGDAPDGVAWTGFASVASDKKSAYLLVFREASPTAKWQIDLPFLPGRTEVSTLAGDGSATLLQGQRLEVTIPESHRFLFVRVGLATAE